MIATTFWRFISYIYDLNYNFCKPLRLYLYVTIIRAFCVTDWLDIDMYYSCLKTCFIFSKQINNSDIVSFLPLFSVRNFWKINITFREILSFLSFIFVLSKTRSAWKYPYMMSHKNLRHKTYLRFRYLKTQKLSRSIKIRSSLNIV